MKKCIVGKYVGIVLVLNLVICLTGCTKLREKKYYADTDNFITGEGIVDNIIYDKESGDIVFWLSEIDDVYQCGDFIIEGQNIPIVLENGILDKVKLGDKITFTSAPGYFGNGDFMPLVAISIRSEEILSFEEGYKNLMKLY